MRSREGRLGSVDLAPEELLRPVVDTRGSDSQILDEALELLTRGGRDVATRGIDARSRRVGGRPRCRRRGTRLLPLPRVPDRAVGRTGWAGLLRRTEGGGGARSKRAAAVADLGLRRRSGRVLVGSRSGLDARARSCAATPHRARARSSPSIPVEGGVLEDATIKTRLARRRPYGDWVAEHMDEAVRGKPVTEVERPVLPRQVASGYSKEEFTVVIRPMAIEGHEPTSSMGDDTAQAPLTSHARSDLRPPEAALRSGHEPADRPPARTARHVAQHADSGRAITASREPRGRRAARVSVVPAVPRCRAGVERDRRDRPRCDLRRDRGAGRTRTARVAGSATKRSRRWRPEPLI